MRILVTTFLGALALAGSAFATNIAINATVTSNPSFVWTANGHSFAASNAVDGTTSTQWVAPPNGPGIPVYTGAPYLLINLGNLFTLDYVSVQGVGNLGLTTSFDIFVSSVAPTAGDLSSLSNLESDPNNTLVLTVLNQQDGTAWTNTGLITPNLQAQYVLYFATNSTVNCPVGGCTPGDGVITSPGVGVGQDDAFASEITVDAVPEPATFGLISFSLLALGFARRSRKQSR
jgi:hypothetical protein